MLHKLMLPSEVRRFVPQMEASKVSLVARDKGGFLRVYLRYGARMLDEIAPGGTITWGQKRTNFIRRHLVQYKKNRTERRRLALIAWAYKPK